MEQNSASNPLAGLHKQKLYTLIIAGIGIISCILPWWSLGAYGYHISINGLHELGWLSFLGFIGAGAVIFVMGDKTKPFEGQSKMIAAACLGGAGAIALIQMLRSMHGLAIGIFLAIAAGVIGALFVWGMVKMPDQAKKGPTPPAS